MILLTATTHALELETSSASSTDWNCSYVDMDASSTTPGSGQGNVASATTTTVAAAPGASTQRQVKLLTVRNKGSSAQTATVKKDVSGTEYVVFAATLQPSEQLIYTDGDGFRVVDSAGREKTQANIESGFNGFTRPFYKVGTTTEAAGVRYCFAKDSGFPGAFTVGTPGVNGRTTDGTTSTDAGCIGFADPASGGMYLTDFAGTASNLGVVELIDLVWINTGITVTTTTAQAIASGTLPARDINGSSNGEGYEAGILVTTTTTNAGAVTNTTLNYTNEAGTATRTATIASFPATCVAGSLVPFQLAAGDKGVRSIQGVTLGTSYGGGAISIVVYRRVGIFVVPGANYSNPASRIGLPGIRLWNRSCIFPIIQPTGAAAYTISGQVTIMER